MLLAARLLQERCLQWEGKGGGRSTGDGSRKGGNQDLYNGGKQERNSKGKLSLFVSAYHPVKETNPTTFLDIHLTSPRLKAKFYAKRQKRKIRTRDKKKKRKAILR